MYSTQVGRKKKVFIVFVLSFLSSVLPFYVLLFVFHMFLFLCLIISLRSFLTSLFCSYLVCISSPLRTLLNPQTISQNSARFVFYTLRLIQPAYRRCRRGCLTVTANFRSAPSSVAVAPRDLSSIYYGLSGICGLFNNAASSSDP